MTPEGRVKEAIKKLGKERGVYSFMPVVTTFGKKGVDFYWCYHGQFIAIEAKAGDNKPTANQQEVLNEVKKAGGYAVVENSEGCEWVRSILDAIDLNLPKLKMVRVVR